MRLTFLGTGTSFGVPQIGCGCAVCHSTDPRDKRTRSGAIVESRTGTRVLIDTPPELRLQLVAANVGSVDAVVFTHAHADHIHGIDDVRAFTIGRGSPLPMYGSTQTLRRHRATGALHSERKHEAASGHIQTRSARISRWRPARPFM